MFQQYGDYNSRKFIIFFKAQLLIITTKSSVDYMLKIIQI